MKNIILEKTITKNQNFKFSFGMRKLIFTILFISAILPVNAYAQANNQACSDNVENISDLLNLAGCIIRSALIPLLITLSVIIFIIGVIKYIAGADDSAKREDGRKFMLYGIIALFVMISIWGLVGILQGTFGLGNTILIPQMQGV